MKNIIAYTVMGSFFVFCILSLITQMPEVILTPDRYTKTMQWVDLQWVGILLIIGAGYIRKKNEEYAHGTYNTIFMLGICLGIVVYGSQILTYFIMSFTEETKYTGAFGKLSELLVSRSGLLVSLLVSFLVFRFKLGSFLISTKDSQSIGASKNGGKFIEEKLKKDMDIDHVKKQNPGDILLCWDRQTGKSVVIPEKDRNLHLFCVGPTGSGKSSTLVLPMIYQDLKVPNSGIGLIEPKGDIAETAYKMALLQGRTDAILFDPTNEEATVFFNPLDPMYGKDIDVINLMTTVYDGMAGGPGTDQFFHKNSMMVLRKSLDLLLKIKRLEGGVLTLRELAGFLTGKTAMLKYCQKLASHKRLEDEAILTWFMEELIADTKSAQNNQGYYIGLRQEIELLGELSWLNGDPETGKSQLNFDDLLANGGIFFASTGFGALGTMGNYLGQFLIMAFQNAIFRRPGTEETRKSFYMYIDEFSLYANDNFERWLALARSYRCPAHLFTQGTSQLEKVSPEFKKSAINNCRHKVIFAPEEEEEAKYWSEYFGEIYKEKVSKSSNKGSSKQWQFIDLIKTPDSTNTSEGESTSEELVKNYTSTDVMNMPFKHVVYKTVKDGTNQIARYGVTDWIPSKVNASLKKINIVDHLKKERGNIRNAVVEEEDLIFD